MKKIATVIGLFMAVGFYVTAYAQNGNMKLKGVAPLQVGDLCPDFHLTNLLNTDKSSIKLSDFKGKVVILDFWATWCGPCVKAMPGLDSLQKAMDDKLVVIPVSKESSNAVVQFLKRSKALKNLGLPILTGDTQLYKYFPHEIIPHEVWISPDGRVYAFTDAGQVNMENVLAAYENKPAKIVEKVDVRGGNYNLPFLLGGLGEGYKLPPEKLNYNSLITSHIPGIAATASWPRIGGDVCKMRSTNNTIEGLYQLALATKLAPISGPKDPNFYLGMSSRLIWEESEIKDKYYLNFGKKRGIYKSFPEEDRTFCFELTVPRNDSLNINKYAVEDLNRFFGSKFNIEGLKEKRIVDCLVLRKIEGAKPPFSKGEKSDMVVDVENRQLKVINTKMTEFMFYWMNVALYLYETPIIDETGIEAPVDFDISCNITDPEAVGGALRKYGLELVHAKRSLDMIVIRSKYK